MKRYNDGKTDKIDRDNNEEFVALVSFRVIKIEHSWLSLLVLQSVTLFNNLDRLFSSLRKLVNVTRIMGYNYTRYFQITGRIKGRRVLYAINIQIVCETAWNGIHDDTISAGPNSRDAINSVHLLVIVKGDITTGYKKRGV